MHGEHPNGNRPWPTFKPPAEPAAPVSKSDRLAKAAASPSPGPGVAALIDIPHPKGEVLSVPRPGVGKRLMTNSDMFYCDASIDSVLYILTDLFRDMWKEQGGG